MHTHSHALLLFYHLFQRKYGLKGKNYKKWPSVSGAKALLYFSFVLEWVRHGMTLLPRLRHSQCSAQGHVTLGKSCTPPEQFRHLEVCVPSGSAGYFVNVSSSNKNLVQEGCPIKVCRAIFLTNYFSTSASKGNLFSIFIELNERLKGFQFN